MKKSEELRHASQMEENDLKAMGLLTKSLREGRSERFVEDILPKILKMGYDVVDDGNNKYTIDTDSQEEKFGIVDYFPKANKILIRKENKWIKPGHQWLISNLLNYEKNF